MLRPVETFWITAAAVLWGAGTGLLMPRAVQQPTTNDQHRRHHNHHHSSFKPHTFLQCRPRSPPAYPHL